MKFQGTLHLDKYCCRVSDDEPDECGIQIGRKDVIDDVKKFDGDPVTVTVNGTVIARGVSLADMGWGYSEWTPMDSDTWQVGEQSLFDLLHPYDGKIVTLEVEPYESEEAT